jgi:hypothetical protein
MAASSHMLEDDQLPGLGNTPSISWPVRLDSGVMPKIIDKEDR